MEDQEFKRESFIFEAAAAQCHSHLVNSRNTRSHRRMSADNVTPVLANRTMAGGTASPDLALVNHVVLIPTVPAPFALGGPAWTDLPLDLCWNYIRNPAAENYAVKNGCLTLKGDNQTLSTANGNPVFIGIRQQACVMRAETTLRLPETGKAGITAF